MARTAAACSGGCCPARTALLQSCRAAGPRAGLRAAVKAAAPIDHPDVGLYHPDLPGRIGADAARLPRREGAGTVGVLVMRSYVLAGNTAHYDGVVRALDLSPRQARVVRLILQGRRDKQIAEHLSLSVATVRTYLARIFARLGVADRVELVLCVWAASRQLAGREACPHNR